MNFPSRIGMVEMDKIVRGKRYWVDLCYPTYLRRVHITVN